MARVRVASRCCDPRPRRARNPQFELARFVLRLLGLPTAQFQRSLCILQLPVEGCKPLGFSTGLNGGLLSQPTPLRGQLLIKPTVCKRRLLSELRLCSVQ